MFKRVVLPILTVAFFAARADAQNPGTITARNGDLWTVTLTGGPGVWNSGVVNTTGQFVGTLQILVVRTGQNSYAVRQIGTGAWNSSTGTIITADGLLPKAVGMTIDQGYLTQGKMYEMTIK